MTYSNTVCSAYIHTTIISDPPSLQDLNLNLALGSYYRNEDNKLLTLTGFFLHTITYYVLMWSL